MRMVAEVSKDHAQLRTFIYDFARIKLRKDLYPRFVEGAWSEIEEQMRGLEAAIERIEADFGGTIPSFQSKSQGALPDGTEGQAAGGFAVGHFDKQGTTRFGDGGNQARPLLLRSTAYDTSSLPIVSERSDRFAHAFLGKQLRSSFWRNTQLLLAVVIGVAIYVASDANTIFDRMALNAPERLAPVVATPDAVKEANVAVGENELRRKSDDPPRRRVADVPIPTEYGAYAVVDGRLTELEQLAIRVPDPRVAISAAISIPSRAHLPVGPRQFVIFRRDLMNSAPDRAAVRIVAQVVRALSFDSAGHPIKSNVEQSWVIRNDSYPMRVAPLADNPEMIIIRSETTDFVLPSGRYALVLKGVGYDFTVDGPVTDVAHCLERTEALNAPIYSECQKP